MAGCQRPLASALLRLLAARADRLAAFSDVDWDKALAWLRGRSEYPAVVIPLTMGSWMMLQRNLLYTGVTRAKKLVVLAGSRRALAVAVRSKGSGRRHTALAHRLRG
jgi:hypothetical protein